MICMVSWVTVYYIDFLRFSSESLFSISLKITKAPGECTVYPKKYAHGFCFAVLCCGHPLTDFPISIRLTSLALWQSNDCPSASKATLMNMDKYFMWIHYERFHNQNKAKHIKPCAYFLGYTVFDHCYTATARIFNILRPNKIAAIS